MLPIQQREEHHARERMCPKAQAFSVRTEIELDGDHGRWRPRAISGTVRQLRLDTDRRSRGAMRPCQQREGVPGEHKSTETSSKYISHRGRQRAAAIWKSPAQRYASLHTEGSGVLPAAAGARQDLIALDLPNSNNSDSPLPNRGNHKQ